MELANPQGNYVKVTRPSYSVLRAELYDEPRSGTKPTPEVDIRELEIQIKLPTSSKKIVLDWVDTPGEIWRQSWQANNPKKWKSFLDTIRTSEGILLIVPPHRGIVKQELNIEQFITQQQWCNRFERWAEFFIQDCPNARHILICLNKADLLRDIDLKEEGRKLAFDPDGSQMNWQQRQMYVLSRFFRPVQEQVQQINQKVSGLSVRCFITSIYDRALLELPWIYLGSFLAK